MDDVDLICGSSTGIFFFPNFFFSLLMYKGGLIGILLGLGYSPSECAALYRHECPLYRIFLLKSFLKLTTLK